MSANELESLLRDYLSGMPIRQLAASYRISADTIRAHYRRAGLEPRYGVVDRELLDARRLYEGGWSLARVGKKLGVDPATVRRSLMTAGVEMRPRPGWRYED